MDMDRQEVDQSSEKIRVKRVVPWSWRGVCLFSLLFGLMRLAYEINTNNLLKTTTIHIGDDRQQEHQEEQPPQGTNSTKDKVHQTLAVDDNNFDCIPQNMSILGQKFFPACQLGPPLNRTSILETFHHQPPWNDMDWRDGIQQMACGGYKCFIRSKSDTTKGYLLAPPTIYQDMVKATDIQNDLRDTFHANVLTTPGEGPQLLNIAKALACLYLEYFGADVWKPQNVNIHRKTILETSQIVVQPVPQSPTPHLLVKSYKPDDPVSKWSPFMDTARDANATAAYQQLIVEFAKMKEVLQKYPPLFCDWQALIDIQGNVYHIDVDRMFPTAGKTNEECNEERIQKGEKNYKKKIPQFLAAAKKKAREMRNETL